MGITTIQLDSKTRDALAKLKAAGHDTYDSLLQKLIRLVPEGDDEGLFNDAFRMGLLEARLDVHEGRVMSHDDVKKRLGL